MSRPTDLIITVEVPLSPRELEEIAETLDVDIDTNEFASEVESHVEENLKDYIDAPVARSTVELS